MALVQRRWTRALLALVALALAGLAIQSLAWAFGDFAGTTSQHRQVNVAFNQQLDRVVRVGIQSRANCVQRGASAHDFTKFLSPFDRSTATYFADRKAYKTQQVKYRVIIRTAITGYRVSRHRWSGNFHARVRVLRRRDGRVVDRCHTGHVRWSATD